MSNDPIKDSTKKKFLFVHRKAPYGRFQGREFIDTGLMAAAFEQELSMLFMDDGLFMLLDQQQPATIQSKDFSEPVKKFSGYGIDEVFVDAISMKERGLDTGDFVIDVTILGTDNISELMDEQDIILSS